MLRRLIGEEVELHAEPATGLGRLSADAQQLEQVLLNPATNARPGGDR